MSPPDSTDVPASLTTDLRTAVVLSGAYGLSGAGAALLLLPAIAQHTEVKLPMPAGVFAAILAVQLTVIYGLLGWAGLRLARARGMEPAPTLTALWRGRGLRMDRRGMALSAISGSAVGLFLVVAVALISRALPGTLPDVLHPPDALTALAASTSAAFGEEILCRLFLLSAIVRLLPRGLRWGRPAAITASALAFALLHTPAMVALYGGMGDVPGMAWVWVIGLNTVVGVVFGVLFLRFGIGAAIAGHWFCDLLWHVGSALF